MFSEKVGQFFRPILTTFLRFFLFLLFKLDKVSNTTYIVYSSLYDLLMLLSEKGKKWGSVFKIFLEKFY